MNFKHTIAVTMMLASSFSCGSRSEPNAARNNAKASATNPPTSAPAPTPKDGDYDGKGVVTKINMELGSVEVNHKEIKDLMPAMTMEFFVSDKKMLEGLKLGDEVDFVIRYKDRNETIVKITKTQ